MENLTQQFCTFHVGDLFLGIAVQQVQEVFRFQQMTRVPLAPSAVHGLINLRGQIVMAVDVRTRLGLPARSSGRPPMNVVVRTDDGASTLLVGEIGGVQEVHAETFERPPETLDSALRSLILGTYKLTDRLLLVLDTAEAVRLQAA